MEFWIETNIQPISPQDMDRVLFEHIKPIVDHLKQQNWLITWHFLRESRNWRGRGDNPPFIQHIRFRVRSNSAHIQNVRDYLKDELEGLKQDGKIADYYFGNHGKPNEDYIGESENFDENAPNPEGWKVTQK